MEKKEIFKRYLLFIIGLFFAGIGVAFTKHGELGVSPISSIANVMSCQFTNLSLGYWLIIWNCLLIILQVLILKKEFKIIQLLQIPLSFLFGWFTDLGMLIVSKIAINNAIMQYTMLLIGTIILAFGITLSVIANVIMNSGEALVKAISDKSKKSFGGVKVIFDVSCVVIAVIMSLIMFNGKIIGTGIGTIFSALLTGFIVKFFTKLAKRPLEKLITNKAKA